MAKAYVPYTGAIVTREAAKAVGLTRFFTGKPCKHGHLSERTTANGGCIACNGAACAALYYAEGPEKRALRKVRSKAWKDAHREQIRAEARAYSKAHREQRNAWKAANRDRINAAARAAYDPERCRAYYQSRRDELLNRAKEYYLANTTAVKQRVKLWREQNPKRVLELRRAYQRANKALIEQRVREWNAANPEAKRSRGRNYRARLNAAEGQHTGEEIKALYAQQNGECVYCQTALGDDYHADHIKPLSRGGSNWITNIQLLCKRCNNRKRATDPVEYARRLGLLL